MNLLDPSQISVVLVQPTQPGNIGAAARAMDNMGVTDLRLVNPCHYFHPEARMFAMNARYLLHQAKTFSSLREAIKDCQLIIATTAREREKTRKLTGIHSLAETFLTLAPKTSIAIVFGTEKSGLNNSDLSLCNEWIYIPTYGKSSSLNLSQAVMVTLFELSKLYHLKSSQEERSIELASSESLEGMKKHFFKILEKTGFIRGPAGNTIWQSFSNLIGRAKPDERDIRMLRGFFNRIEVTLKKSRQTSDRK